jgi:NAD(P)-dependent dehydrogenase (short-subunit alcohol dehydrogenase family)
LAFILPGFLFPEKSPAQVDTGKALLTFRTNTLGPLLILKHFEPFLPRKNFDIEKQADATSSMCTNLPPTSVVAVMSARVGSISDNHLGGWYSYRASKAGVNQVVKTFDNHLKAVSGDKAMALGLHPGTVKTELSKEFWGNVPKEKLFEPDWVAERLVQVVRDVGVHGRGKCWAWDRTEVPP